MLDLAVSKKGINANDIEFDAEPWLLNCPNGTLDLKTGELRLHSPKDNLTTMCPTKYNPDAQCPRWLQFIREIACEDAKLADYIQKTCGYVLTGSTHLQTFYVLLGNGANGKSVFLATLQHILGEDYSCQISSEVLLRTGLSQHSTGVASIRGARLVCAMEPPFDGELDESRVKQFTGGDKVTARRMRQDPMTFRPACKLFIACNSRLKIHDQTKAMKRRLRVIPFDADFSDNPDAFLAEKLNAEAEGILAWAVRGALSLGEQEPPRPPVVVEVSKQWCRVTDSVTAFLHACCCTGPEFKCASETLADLFSAYQEYTKHEYLGKIRFSARLVKLGYKKGTNNNNSTIFSGIKLRVPGEENPKNPKSHMLSI